MGRGPAWPLTDSEQLGTTHHREATGDADRRGDGLPTVFGEDGGDTHPEGRRCASRKQGRSKVINDEAAAIVATRAGARARLAIAADPAVQEALERLVTGELDPLALVRFLERHTADA